MRMLTTIQGPGRPEPPLLRHSLDNPSDRTGVPGIGSEIPGFREVCTSLKESLCEEKVAAQRFEHVLPRARRVRVADSHRQPGIDRTQDVRNEAIS